MKRLSFANNLRAASMMLAFGLAYSRARGRALLDVEPIQQAKKNKITTVEVRFLTRKTEPELFHMESRITFRLQKFVTG